MLPGLSGYDICKQLRSKKIATPILMLTAKGQEIDKVVGLDLGADDYVTKPFGVRELLARIHALLRRTGATAATEQTGNGHSFQIGDVAIDPKTFPVRRGKTVEELTAKELKLLQLFSHSPRRSSLPRPLAQRVWGYNYYGTTRTLDQVIVQLRKKLGDNGGRTQTSPHRPWRRLQTCSLMVGRASPRAVQEQLILQFRQLVAALVPPSPKTLRRPQSPDSSPAAQPPQSRSQPKPSSPIAQLASLPSPA